MWLVPLASAASVTQHADRFYPPDAVDDPVRAPSVADFGFGSGFVLADGRTVVTCLHVAREVGAAGVVVLGRGTTDAKTVRVEILGTAPELDLAPYRADQPPDGDPISVSYGHLLRTGIVVTSVPAVEYDARTGWGSSGSAVLDAQGQAIAVHWAWNADRRWDGWMLGIPLAQAADRWPLLAAALARGPSSVGR